MKGLRLFIPPFAPDQSGAAGVFCELGGLTVIVDAGGCAGNICGFDEPRWFSSRSAIFSAGLRDMDAILGRDDKLVAKIADVSRKIESNFVAIIGTPVPAVIGTDYQALKRMIGKKTGLPVMAAACDGTRLYDDGAGEAFLELFRTFAEDSQGPQKGLTGLIGAAPMDLGRIGRQELIRACTGASRQGQFPAAEEYLAYGLGGDLDEIRRAGQAEHNIVLSPSGLAAARYLKDRFGTPFTAAYPMELIPEREKILQEALRRENERILIVHQQILACSLRDEISRWRERAGAESARVTAASWFMMDPACMQEGDLQLQEEDDWTELVREGGYDLIIADPLFMRAVPDYSGRFVPLTHFAVSG